MPEYSELEAAWEVSASTVSREINFMVPLLAFYMQKIAPIQWPGGNDVEVVPGLEHHGVSGAIDCTTHYRVTDSYVPHLFFRGDHHACSLTAECKLNAALRWHNFRSHDNRLRDFRCNECFLFASGRWTASRSENVEAGDCPWSQL